MASKKRNKKSETKNKILSRLGGMMLLIAFSIVMIWISAYFDLTLALPGFLASLFFIWVLPKTKYAKFKNIVFSYVFVILFGILVSFGVFQNLLSNINLPIDASILGLTLAILLSTVFMVLFSAEHPPAIAALVFFAYSPLTLHNLIGFTISFFVLVGVQMFLFSASKLNLKYLKFKFDESGAEEDEDTFSIENNMEKLED